MGVCSTQHAVKHPHDIGGADYADEQSLGVHHIHLVDIEVEHFLDDFGKPGAWGDGEDGVGHDVLNAGGIDLLDFEVLGDGFSRDAFLGMGEVRTPVEVMAEDIGDADDAKGPARGINDGCGMEAPEVEEFEGLGHGGIGLDGDGGLGHQIAGGEIRETFTGEVFSQNFDTHDHDLQEAETDLENVREKRRATINRIPHEIEYQDMGIQLICN